MPHDMPRDLCSATATQAVRLIDNSKLRPEALMDAYLDRIASRNPGVEAFVDFEPPPRPERQRLRCERVRCRPSPSA